MKLPESEVERALAAVAQHPLYKEAVAWPYCESDVFAEPKSFIERARFTEAERCELRASLQAVETLVLVGYWTSSKRPEPLTGGGKLYSFLLHPKSFSVIHAGVGTWRS
jgi:hypothetical protein